MRTELEDDALRATTRLEAWLVAGKFRAYEPFDGLSSWVRPLARGKVGRQILQQAVKRSPWNLRPLLGIRPHTSTKAMGYFARGYLRLQGHLEGADERALDCLNWLTANASKGYAGLAWGNHFDYQSRGFYLPAGVPTVVWTAHIGHAFLDAFEAWAREEHLVAARSVATFISEDLEQRPEGTGAGACISYLPTGYYPIHNSNMLAAAVLARTYRHTLEPKLIDVARQAVVYTVSRQRPDGSWWYGEAENFRWVDNWHTGYVLDSLWWYMEATGERDYWPAFERGAHFFVERFFTKDGAPKFYPDRSYPIDIQSAAQAIETLVLLTNVLDSRYAATVRHVCRWTLSKMQDAQGYFYFQRWPRYIAKTPMLHWGQATMFLALATVATSGIE